MKMLHQNIVCFYVLVLMDTVILMSTPKFHNLETPGVGKILLTGSNAESKLFRDPCAGHIRALKKRTGKFLLTQDSFLSTHEVYVNVSSLENPPPSLNVSETVFIHNSFVIRVGEQVYIIDGDAGGALSVPDGFPDSGVEHILSKFWCDNSYDAEIANDIFAAWYGDELFIYGLNGMKSFRNFTIPKDLFHTIKLENMTISIIDAVLSHLPGPILGVVAKVTGSSETKLVVLMFQSKTQTWKLLPLMLDLTEAPPPQQDFKFFFLFASDDFYLYNKHSVYLVWNGGQSVDPLTLMGDNSSVLASTDEMKQLTASPSVDPLTLMGDNSSVLASTDEIKQLTANPSGDVIILMTSNTVFYGKFDNHKLIELSQRDPAHLDILFNFDPLSNLYSVEIHDTNVTRRSYPLRHEIISALYPNVHCAYSQLLHNIIDFYVIDLREKLTLWAMLVYPQIRGNHIELTVSKVSQDLVEDGTLHHDVDVSYEFSKGMIAMNNTMTFSVGTSFYGVENYNALKASHSGTNKISLQPLHANFACKAPVQLTTIVYSGCPEGRMMKLRRSAFTENCTIPERYTIEKKYSIRSRVEELVYYDMSLGCLIQIHNNEEFKPIFDIYDKNGERYLSPMDGNFILWDENGREDFSYKNTMREVDCKTEAQTWTKMRKQYPDIPDRDVWGPQNYRDCFIDDLRFTGDLSQKYQILNLTSTNAIVFEQNHNAIFVFRAKVVDPNYSFCTYEERFAVYVHGWFAEDRVLPLVISSTLFGISTIVFIVVSYTMFKKKINAELEIQNMRKMTAIPLIASLVDQQQSRRFSVLRPAVSRDIKESTMDH